MYRNIILGLALSGVLPLSGQTGTPMSIDQMKGDYIILNTLEYEGIKNISDMRNLTLTPVNGEDSLIVSGFYQNKCPDFKAGYNETTGDITIAAGIAVFNSGNMVQYLYPWSETNEDITERPITYRYQGNGSWTTTATLVLMSGYAGSTLTPFYFAQGSEIRLANAESHNLSFAGVGNEQQQFDERRPAFFRLEENQASVYNLLTTDQYGYGCKVEGEIDRTSGKALFAPSVVGQANDGTYKILAGCELDEANNIPTRVTNKDTSAEGDITACVDLEKGILSFGPMAIFPAVLENGYLSIDDQSFFELIKSVELTFDPEKIVSITPEELTGNPSKEIDRVEYYTLEGIRTGQPQPGTVSIRKTTYKDQSIKVEKIYLDMP